jgi:hypothetical protein
VYSNDPGLLGNVLTWPAEISAVQPQCSKFCVATSDTDCVDAFASDTGVGRLTTKFKLSLLAIRGSLSTSCCTLVTGVARDTHPITFVSRRSSMVARPLCRGKGGGTYLVVG